MPAGVFDLIKQQTFFGASVINWNINLGYNSSPTQLNLNLVNDKSNQELPNGANRGFNGGPDGEGYHCRKTKAADTAPTAIRAGKYPANDFNSTAANVILHPPHYEAGFGRGTLPRYDFGIQAMVDARRKTLYELGDYFCPPPVGTPVWFNYYLFDSTDARAGFPVTLQTSYPWNVGSFNGIFTDYTMKTSTGGESISVTVQDPRLILEGVQVILDGHRRTLAPGDFSKGVITSPYTRRYQDGYAGYYNMLNVFGYYENFFKWNNEYSNRFTADSSELDDTYAPWIPDTPGFGVADINEAGMKFYDPRARLHAQFLPPAGLIVSQGPGWPGIFPALQHMLMGHPDAVYTNNRPGLVWQVADPEKRMLNEDFGGPVYYLPKATVPPVPPLTGHLANELSTPTNPYRYKVDLSEMKKLFEDTVIGGVPGPLPRYYRVKASSMNLLELIDSVCKAANADFFVELLPDVDPLGNFTDDSFDGVIKIYVRLKQFKQETNIIASYIRGAENSTGPVPGTNYALNNPHIPPGLFPHVWFNRLVSHDVGKELPNNALGKVVMGAPKTRVVGVKEMGIDFVREELCACESAAGVPIPGLTTQGTCIPPPVPPPIPPAAVDNTWNCLREIQEFDGVRGPNNHTADPAAWFNSGYKHHRWNEEWRRFEDTWEKTNKRVEDFVGRRFWDVIEEEWTYIQQDIENDNWNAESEFFRFNIHDGCSPLDANGNIDFAGGETKPCGVFVNDTDGDAPGSKNTSFVEDHRIDIFPAWGFAPKYFQHTITGMSGPEDVTITNLKKGIKGEFDSMNPYWDWHALAGLPGIFEFVIYDLEDPKAAEILPNGGAPLIKAEIERENSAAINWGVDTFTSVQECVRYKCENDPDGRTCVPKWQDNMLHPKKVYAEYENNVFTFSEIQAGIEAWNDAVNGCGAPGVVKGISRFGLERLRHLSGLDDDDYRRVVTGAPIKHDTGKCMSSAADDAVPVPTTAYGAANCTATWIPDDPQREMGATGVPRQIKRNGKFKEPCSKGRNIQVDMRDIGYQANDGIHLATVTELRHALIGQSEWMDYIRRFDSQFSLDLHFDPKDKKGNPGSWIAQVMGASHIAASAPAAGPAPGGGTSPVVLNANTGQGVLINHVGADLDNKKKIHDRAYEIVKTVATDWYGKKFFVPLPYDPQMRTEYSKRTHGDDDGLIASFNVTNSWEIAEGGWVEPKLGGVFNVSVGGVQFNLNGPAHQKDVKYPYDLSFWNDTGQMQPFLVYPYKVWQHIKESKTEEVLYLPTDPVSDDLDLGCVKCDGNAWSTNTEDPPTNATGDEANGGPWSSELDCRHFNENSVLNNGNFDNDNICNVFRRDETSEIIKLEFAPLDFSELDRNSYYIEQERDDDIATPFCLDETISGREACTNVVPGNNDRDPYAFLTPDGMWGSALLEKNTTKPSAWITNSAYLTRVWVKASVESETYWMHSDIYRYGRIVPDSTSGTTCEGSAFGGSINTNVAEQNACSQLRPFALISTDSAVRYDKNSVIGPSAWTVGSAWVAVTMDSSTGLQTGGALGATTPAGAPSYGSSFSIYNAMAPAAYKPWDAAVPQISNVESWGPWSAGDHIGKADFEEDTSLTPETFGSIKRMGDAGISKVAAAASEFTDHERGSITMWGLPEFPIGAPIVAGGPYVTNITTDMGTGGINTTYRMETYKRQNPAQRDWWDADRDARVFRSVAQRLKSERDNIVLRNRPQTD